ncbi:hypothetical protein Y032_0644g1081 [Ancylostoma ceylanicum]|uniref:Uncharacterized protein n=1 Tax=Ancylostoma ceylanicum TaxID=53326 RepID=A0A016WIQ5_9BILA|nr:hypothetical protein Y032_0644g1081 [Ancylostoma ceylanicum]
MHSHTIFYALQRARQLKVTATYKTERARFAKGTVNPRRRCRRSGRGSRIAPLASTTAMFASTPRATQAVHVTAGSLVDIRKTTMKRDTQIRYDDVECWRAWILDRLGELVVSDRPYLHLDAQNVQCY